MQPSHTIDDGRWAEKVIGPERIKTTYAFKSLIDAGAIVSFGSDWPVASASPLEGIYAAVTRITLDGKNPEGWVPKQKITPEEALIAYTKNGAYASFEENVKGTLAPGKLADFVIISDDITKVEPQKIKDLKILKTFVGGEKVFDANMMPKKDILFIGTAISMFFVPWILVKAWILPLPDTVQEQVDEAIGHGFDGMIVYVDQAGKPPEFYTAGWKDRENKLPAHHKLLFKIGSISKLYTAVAATKLVKEKRLSFNKTLADYLPELRNRIENAEEITLRMMIQHRSGIPNFTDNPAYWENEQENGKNALDFALDLPATFKPNGGYKYSNTNYLLLRRIMDNILGYSHNLYIKEKILIPLELKNTFFSITEVDLDNVMSGVLCGIRGRF